MPHNTLSRNNPIITTSPRRRNSAIPIIHSNGKKLVHHRNVWRWIDIVERLLVVLKYWNYSYFYDEGYNVTAIGTVKPIAPASPQGHHRWQVVCGIMRSSNLIRTHPVTHRRANIGQADAASSASYSYDGYYLDMAWYYSGQEKRTHCPCQHCILTIVTKKLSCIVQLLLKDEGISFHLFMHSNSHIMSIDWLRKSWHWGGWVREGERDLGDIDNWINIMSSKLKSEIRNPEHWAFKSYWYSTSVQ